jgi:hypothetical protein
MWGAVKVAKDAGGVGVSPKSISTEELRAAKIRAYWGKLGYGVETRVELVRKRAGEEFYLPGVRSDMLNGYPRDHPVNARLVSLIRRQEWAAEMRRDGSMDGA